MCGICGLGYAAEVIDSGHQGIWPKNAEQLLAEKGLHVADASALFDGPPLEPTETQSDEVDPTGFSPFFDIPSGTSTPYVLGVGQRINAEISVQGDTDWFGMQLVQGQTYQISLRSLPFFGLGDPELYLFDNFGNFLTFDDNSGEGLNSLLTITATRTGVYYIGATGFGGTGQSVGQYEISLAQVNFGADTVGQTKATAGTVAVDSSVTGTIDFGTDQDWYEVTVQKGKTYAVFLDSAVLSFTPLADPKVEVVDRNLASVAFNDDNGVTKNAALTFTADYNGKYYIKAMGGPANTGDFKLTVADFSPPEPASPLDALDWGVKLDNPHVTYYFAKAGETFGDDTFGNELTDTDWSAYQKAQAIAAMGEYTKVSNLTFAEVSNSSQADFILTKNFLDSANTGRMIPPDPQYGAVQGVGWFNTNPTYWSDASGKLLDKFAFGYGNFIHEFGHGLGLSHPHDDGGGQSAIMAGVTSSGTRGDFGLNSRVFTVMSYIDGWTGGPAIDPTNQAFGFPGSLMAMDIAVIQEKYGVNNNHNGGNTVYTLPNANGTATGYEAIWDTGGKDTFVHTGSMGATIDLRQATLKSELGGGGFMSFATGIHGGLTIAKGVKIENATGGSANDTLVGNGLKNQLDGKGGNDVMIGGKGNDTYFISAAGDVVSEAANGGKDDIVRSGAIDLVLGDYANVENATLTGSSDLDATGTAVSNLLIGNKGKNLLSGKAGNDTVKGGAGKDTLKGEAGKDNLQGQAANDKLNGGSGNDTLDGGKANDRLTGGKGLDDFIFKGTIGNDKITDFAKGKDELHLSDALWTGTLTKAQVVNQLADVVGGNVVFDFGANGSITLLGVSSKSGLASDLEFI